MILNHLDKAEYERLQAEITNIHLLATVARFIQFTLMFFFGCITGILATLVTARYHH